MTEPLLPVAQEQAGLFPRAAHVVQKNGTRPDPEAWDWFDVQSFGEESLT